MNPLVTPRDSRNRLDGWQTVIQSVQLMGLLVTELVRLDRIGPLLP
jgi:hypothetical protein